MGFVQIKETHIDINSFGHFSVRYVVCLHASHTLAKTVKLLLKIVVLNVLISKSVINQSVSHICKDIIGFILEVH